MVSESFLRDLIIFTLIFILIVAQGWDDVTFLLFPLITFGFSIFFKILDINKSRILLDDTTLLYNPLGSEKIIYHRLFFCTLIQSILLFWFGAESLYHPQLIDDFYMLFIFIYLFFYTFSFYYIFIDVWKYCRIELRLNDSETSISNNYQIDQKNFDNVISFLKMKSFKITSIINLLVFVTLNTLNIIFTILIINNMTLGIKINLPGTGFEGSEPIYVSFFMYFAMIIPPIMAIIFLKKIYNDINDYDTEKLNYLLKSLPKSSQNNILRTISMLNNKLKNKVRME
ncbi:MAG: hypothetical protein EU539_06850 [Promethearchaeota archaeon]|nr:MAG: hypothetical protein EU539_06850 [Candidatus Lokiarchaeota archaeon]